jgi:hypothetical protein
MGKLKNLDIEYLELMLSQSFSVRFVYEKNEENYFGKLQYIYSDKNIAYAALYYFYYKFKNELIAIALELTSENILIVTLNIWDENIKIKTQASSCNWGDLSIMIDNANFPTLKDSIVAISFQYQKNYDSEDLNVSDDIFGNGINGVVRGYLHKYDNAGHSLLPPGDPL